METVISSARQEVRIGPGLPFVIIGERINPTGRKKLAEMLRQGDLEMVRRDAVAQVEAGAQVVDVNVGVPGIDEPKVLVEAVQAVSEVVDVPLCIDSANPSALEAALSVYKGKALVNSVNGEEEKLRSVLPLVKRYGAALVCLTMDDQGIPSDVEGRLEIAKRIFKRAIEAGIPPADLVFDPLVLPVSVDHRNGLVTLETLKRISEELGVNSTMGASNVSFGLPDREAINAAFLVASMARGLTSAITNPLLPELRKALAAGDLVLGHDEYAANWIRFYRASQKAAQQSQRS